MPPRGPVALPVNYAMQQGTVLFRTSPYNSLARHLRETPACSFEVDHVDAFTRSGWSVLVRGSADLVRHPGPAQGSVQGPEPWPEGSRALTIRVTAHEITGRRLHPS